eukprot:EG_transcript_5966
MHQSDDDDDDDDDGAVSHTPCNSFPSSSSSAAAAKACGPSRVPSSLPSESPPHSPASSTSHTSQSKYLQRYASMPSTRYTRHAPPPPGSSGESPPPLGPSGSPQGDPEGLSFPTSQTQPSLFRRRPGSHPATSIPDAEDSEEESEPKIEMYCSPMSTSFVMNQRNPSSRTPTDPAPKRIRSILKRIPPPPSDADPPLWPSDPNPVPTFGPQRRAPHLPAEPAGVADPVAVDLHQLLAPGGAAPRRGPGRRSPCQVLAPGEEEARGGSRPTVVDPGGGLPDLPRSHSTSSVSTKRLGGGLSRSVSLQHSSEEDAPSGSAAHSSAADWPRSQSTMTDISSIQLPRLPSRSHSSVLRADGESVKLDDWHRSDSVLSHSSSASAASLEPGPGLAKAHHSGSFRRAHGRIIHVPSSAVEAEDDETGGPSARAEEEREEFGWFRTSSERGTVVPVGAESPGRSLPGSPLSPALSTGGRKSMRFERGESSTTSEPDMFWGTTFAAKRGLPAPHSPAGPDPMRPPLPGSKGVMFRRCPSDSDSDGSLRL